MTAIEAYALSKKIALGAVSGIQNITINGTQLVFQFKNGGSASMNIPLPKDGISITKVEIDKKNHLICTMSDSTTQDAGEIPGGTGGGVIQVANKNSLPTKGENNVLYITQDDDSIYYWNNGYKSISGSGVDGVNIKTAAIEFDGIETTFNLPIDDKDIIVYLNGMYLTKDEDYTLDRTVKPNTITFIETWGQEDLCSIVWINGVINEGGGSGNVDISLSLAKDEDIDKLFTGTKELSLAKLSDIDNLFL